MGWPSRRSSGLCVPRGTGLSRLHDGLFLVIRREGLPMGTELEWMGRRALVISDQPDLPTLALAAVGASAPVLFHQMLMLVFIVTAFTILALRFLVMAVERVPLPAARRYVLG
jgi:hypothetical protein